MPIATPEAYAEMLDRAKLGGFAYPAVNVTSSETLNLGVGERGRYLLAATFGNVHGVYQPGHVKLRPKLLDEIQRAVAARVGYLAKAETSMAARVVQACNDLGSAGTSLMQAG